MKASFPACQGTTSSSDLAAVYLADLARLEPAPLAGEQALALLGRLAEHAAALSH